MEGYCCGKCKEKVTLYDIYTNNYIIDFNYLQEITIYHKLCHWFHGETNKAEVEITD